MILLCGFLIWSNYWRHLSFFELFCITVVAVAVILGLWRRTSDRGSGLMQVMLAPDGARQGVRGLGPIPYESADRAKLAPWRKIRRVRLKRSSGDQIVLEMMSSKHWWHLGLVYVNAKLKCSPAEADALEVRISQWREAAK
jgi:hypothetical protein